MAIGDAKRALAALVGLLAALLGAGCGGSEERVRIVLVSLDTLRLDAFSGTDGEPGSMPLLLARAGSGTRFERFYAASSTTQPTHATLFTGLHPWQHGITRNGDPLGEPFETLAEALRGVGFATQAVVASYPVAAEFGFGQGFDRYRDDFDVGFSSGARGWEGHAVPGGRFYSRAGRVTDRAIEAIDAATAARQFFFFHYFDPHAPYGSSKGGELLESDVLRRAAEGEPRPALLAHVRGLYREDAAYLDRELERLLVRLDADADRFATHVVLVSDHGESLGERGSIGHGYGLGEVEIRVPAIVLSPDFEPGVRHDVAGSIDVATTLLALAGLPTDATGGRDLRLAKADDARAFGMRRTFRGDSPGERRLDGSVRAIPELLFFAVAPDGRSRIGNGRRIAGGKAAQDEALLRRFRGFERELAAHAGNGSLDPAVEQRLRALGYVP